MLSMISGPTCMTKEREHLHAHHHVENCRFEDALGAPEMMTSKSSDIAEKAVGWDPAAATLLRHKIAEKHVCEDCAKL